jgi:hypothetical protein
MSDIIAFPKPKHPAPSCCYTTADFVWLSAYEIQGRPGRFAYRVGFKHWPLSKLFTFSLPDARAAAESFGVQIKEVGPPEAFGRSA